MPERGSLNIETKTRKHTTRISITDTGCGIPYDTMEEIFEPLFSNKTKGFGLGPAVSKILSEVNSGSIEVKSEEGKGGTFTVILPFKEKAA